MAGKQKVGLWKMPEVTQGGDPTVDDPKPLNLSAEGESRRGRSLRGSEVAAVVGTMLGAMEQWRREVERAMEVQRTEEKEEDQYEEFEHDFFFNLITLEESVGVDPLQ